MLSLLVLALLWLPVPEARASCIYGIVVDGVFLAGHEADDLELPPPAGKRPAVVPACNDAGQNDPDGETTVQRFEGVRADVAVRSLDGDHYFIAQDAYIEQRGDRTVIVGPTAPRPPRPAAPEPASSFPWLPVTGAALGLLVVALSWRRARKHRLRY